MPTDPNTSLGANRLTSATQSGRRPWQEYMDRLVTVPAGKVAQAALVTEGFAGSWAGSWGAFPLGAQDEQRAQLPSTPSSTQVVPNFLGRAGMQEVNFAPYAYRTNRFGSKGGSLVGHPISFGVVGPTLKNFQSNWQWAVTDNALVPGTGDTIQLDTREAYSTTGGVPAVVALALVDCYGFDNTNWETRFPGGLYVAITMTGVGVDLAGSTLIGAGGLGDGFINDTGARAALVPLTAYSHHEIFRVVGIDGAGVITLDPNKRLEDYFTIPGTPVVRQVMFFEPKATRCLAVPDSGTPTGSKTFIVVPPERALLSDNQYPYDQWIDNAFQEDGVPWTADGNTPFADDEYRQGTLLPVPKPTIFTTGRLNGEAADAATPDVGPGHMPVFIDELGGAAGRWVGSVVHITEVNVRDAAELRIDAGTGWQAALNTVLGWFEVFFYDVGSTLYLLRRIDEYEPVAGRAYWYPSVAFGLEGEPIAVGGIDLTMSVHNPIPALWEGTQFEYDRVDSARLNTLIDPNWVKGSLKATVPGLDANRADKAIFDTSSSNGGAAGSNANPGNFYDLGFRAVLFPATLDGSNNIIPDFDRPVASNEVLLDPASTDEPQWVEIDYSNGLIRLSHAPAAGSDLWPTVAGVFTEATHNPRGELVIFCSCVPYSMEEGQLGTVPRIAGTGVYNLDGGSCLDGDSQRVDGQDVYGERIYAPLEAQNLYSQSRPDPAAAERTITLTGALSAQLPQTGFVEILEGQTPYGDPIFSDTVARATTWGYVGVTEAGGNTILHNSWGGGLDALGPVNPIVIGATDNYTAILRRHTNLPVAATGRMLTDYQQDTTYGQAKRGSALRFADAQVRDNLDGSATVTPRETLSNSQTELFNDLFSSWLLEGGELDTASAVIAADVTIPYSAYTIIFEGKRLEFPAGAVTIPLANDDYYLYLEATDTPGSCHEWAYQTTLPLTTEGQILMYRVTMDTGAIDEEVDLRYPLQDVDQRVDIFVGNAEGLPTSRTPHFTTLADAVAYANEIQNPAHGDPGRRLHIRVVGNTTEDAAQLPITIEASGLTISGALDTEITWDVEDQNLINLNGKADLTFERLSFNCTAVTTPGVAIRSVFSNTSGGSCRRLIIRNCRTAGSAQGFIHIGDAGAFQDCSFTRNYGTVWDFGISVTDAPGGYLALTRCVIEENWFEAHAVGSLAAGARFGIYAGAAAPVDSPNMRNQIRGNYLLDFPYGIGGSFTHSTIQGNQVNTSQFRGISLTGTTGTRVSDNHLFGVYWEDPAPDPEGQVGIYVEGVVSSATYDGFNNIIDNNNILLWPGITASAYIGIYSAPGTSTHGCKILNNYCGTTDVYPAFDIYNATDNSELSGNECLNLTCDADDCVISKNQVTGFLELVEGKGNAHIVDNDCANLCVGYNRTTGAIGTAASLVRGNRVPFDGVVYLGEYCSVENNTFMPNAGAAQNATFISTDCRLTNNLIVCVADYRDVPIAGPSYPNANQVIFRAIIGDNNVWNVGEDGAGTSDGAIALGTGTTLTGNRFLQSTGDAVLLETAVAAAQTDYLITGNYFAQPLILKPVGTLPANGARVTVSGNDIRGYDIALFTSLTVEECNEVAISGNVIRGKITDGGTSYDWAVTGNRCGGTILGVVRSSITGNVAYEDAAEAGIDGHIYCSSASSTVAENVCVNLSVLGAGSTCTGNLVVAGPTVTDGLLTVGGGGTVAQGNVIQTKDGSGRALIVSAGADRVVVANNNITDGDILVQAVSSVIVRGNQILLGDLWVAGGQAHQVTGNTLTEGNISLSVNTDKSTVADNILLDGGIAQGAAPADNCTFRGNVIGGSLTVVGDHCALTGNALVEPTTPGIGAIHISGAECSCTGNTVDNFDNTTYPGHDLSIAILDGANYCTITGNTCPKSIIAFATAVEGVVSDNILEDGNIELETGNIGWTISGNVLHASTSAIKTEAERTRITGSRCSTIYVGFGANSGSYSTVEGNTTGDITIAAGSSTDQVVVSGNRLAGGIAVSGERHSITGNTLLGTGSKAGDIYLRTSSTGVVSGNTLHNSGAGTSRIYVENADPGQQSFAVAGNFLDGDIDIGLTVSGTRTYGKWAISGNVCNSLKPNAGMPTFQIVIAVGNNITNINGFFGENPVLAGVISGTAFAADASDPVANT